MLGNQFSYDDYEQFYEEHFAPMTISEDMLLLDPAEILYEEQPEIMNPRLPELKVTEPKDAGTPEKKTTDPQKKATETQKKTTEPKKQTTTPEFDEYYELEGF
jgi:hypothetical protein